jgi:hypothetical protein
MQQMVSLRLINVIVAMFLVLAIWSPSNAPVWGYAPIDNVISDVDRLRLDREIFDISTAANLIVSLGTIGNSIDAGDLATAKELLNAFSQEVASLSGALMTSGAAQELVDAATSIDAGL